MQRQRGHLGEGTSRRGRGGTLPAGRVRAEPQAPWQQPPQPAGGSRPAPASAAAPPAPAPPQLPTPLPSPPAQVSSPHPSARLPCPFHQDHVPSLSQHIRSPTCPHPSALLHVSSPHHALSTCHNAPYHPCTPRLTILSHHAYTILSHLALPSCHTALDHSVTRLLSFLSLPHPTVLVGSTHVTEVASRHAEPCPQTK